MKAEITLEIEAKEIFHDVYLLEVPNVRANSEMLIDGKRFKIIVKSYVGNQLYVKVEEIGLI